MHLDEKKLSDVIENESDTELLVACYTIIESTLTLMANEHKNLILLEQRQRDQLFNALKNVFSTVLSFTREVSDLAARDRHILEETNARNFVCSTIRVLGSWLAEETNFKREEVYAIINFIYTVAVDTFEAQKSCKLKTLPGRRRRGSEIGVASSAQIDTDSDVASNFI